MPQRRATRQAARASVRRQRRRVGVRSTVARDARRVRPTGRPRGTARRSGHARGSRRPSRPTARASPNGSDQYVASVTGRKRPRSSDRPSRRLRSGRRWTLPTTRNGGIETSARSATLGVRSSRIGSTVVRETAKRIDDEIDLGELRAEREVGGAVLLERDVLEDQERLLGGVQDVGDPVVACLDRPPNDELLRVEGERDCLGRAGIDRHDRKDTTRRSACEPGQRVNPVRVNPARVGTRSGGPFERAGAPGHRVTGRGASGLGLQAVEWRRDLSVGVSLGVAPRACCERAPTVDSDESRGSRERAGPPA